MQQYGSKHFAHRPPTPDPVEGTIGQNLTFSEHCHVAYQIY